MTHKTCSDCGRKGNVVLAREWNTSGKKKGTRRCVCRKGCKGKAPVN